MHVSIETTLKRKTHSPGRRGKTLCGKKFGERVPTVTSRPSCQVCTVVFDQAARGIVRIINNKREEEREDAFANGFAFALCRFVDTYPHTNVQALAIFEEAGYELSDLVKLSLDPMEREILNKIYGA